MIENRYSCPLYKSHDAGESPAALSVFIALINGVFSILALISNLLIIFVMFKKPVLRTSWHAFLASQASSNIVVSLLAQPSLIALQIEEMLGNTDGYCTAQLINTGASIICILTTFCSVLGMAINQFLSLQFVTWYIASITFKRVTILIVLAWLATMLALALCFAFGFIGRLFLVAILMAAFLTLPTLVFSIKNYHKIRGHLMQVQQQLEVPTSVPPVVTPNISHHRKNAATVFSILATCFMTHVPLFITFVIAYLLDWSEARKNVFIITLTVAYSYSCLCSVIYFRRNEEIRQEVLHVLGY